MRSSGLVGRERGGGACRGTCIAERNWLVSWLTLGKRDSEGTRDIRGWCGTSGGGGGLLEDACEPSA